MKYQTILKILGVVLVIGLIGGWLASFNWYQPPPEAIYYSQFVQLESPALYIQDLIQYVKANMSTWLPGMNVSQIYDLENKYLTYAPDNLTAWTREFEALNILQGTPSNFSTGNPLVPYKLEGRCQEFSLLGYDLFMAAGYKARVVVDCSYEWPPNNTATVDDHMWNEVMLNGKWTPIDFTQSFSCLGNYTQCCYGYKKEIDYIWALQGSSMVQVTSNYQENKQ
jgi:hypothetical protein